MSMPTLNPELVAALKRLKLGQVIQALPERLVLADKQDMSFEDLLLLVLTDEINRQDSCSYERRAAAAGLDPGMKLAARGFSPDEQQTRLGASAAHRMT